MDVYLCYIIQFYHQLYLLTMSDFYLENKKTNCWNVQGEFNYDNQINGYLAQNS